LSSKQSALRQWSGARARPCLLRAQPRWPMAAASTASKLQYVQYFGARRRQAGSGVSRVRVPYQVRKPGPAAGTPNSSAGRIPAHQPAPAPAPAPRLRSEADDCSTTTTKSPTHWALGLGLPSSPRRRAASHPHRPPPAGSSCRTHTTFPQVPFGFPPSPRRLPSARVPDLSSLPHAAGPSRGKPGLGPGKGSDRATTTFQGPCRIAPPPARPPVETTRRLERYKSASPSVASSSTSVFLL
jgi:hypothetical protein